MRKIFNENAGYSIDEWLSTMPKPRVFSSGCFDIMHLGHISYLHTASMLGSSLIVGVNSDQSVKTLNKDSNRPINPLFHRMAVLSALEVVDGVIGFNQSTPWRLITRLKPDYLVKGGDWTIDQIVGAKEVKSWGGAVISIPVKYPISTTNLIKRIQSL